MINVPESYKIELCWKNKIILKFSRGLAYLKIDVEILKYLERGYRTIFPQEINYFDKICQTWIKVKYYIPSIVEDVPTALETSYTQVRARIELQPN